MSGRILALVVVLVLVIAGGFYFKDPVVCIANPGNQKDVSAACVVTADRILVPGRYRAAALMRASSAMDLEDSGPVIEKALALDPKNATANQAHAELLTDQAFADLSKGAAAEAAQKLSDVLARQPDRKGARLMRAIAYSDQGQFDAAIADQTELLKDNPNNPVILYSRAITLARAGRFQEAITDYSELLFANAQNTDALAGRANARRRMKDFGGALQDIDQLVRLTPKEAYPYVQQANVLFDQGKSEDVVGLVDSAEPALGKIPEMEKAKAISLYRMKFSKDALKILDQAAAADPDDAWIVRVREAIKADKVADVDAGAAELNQSAALDDERAAQAREDLLQQMQHR